MGLLVVLFSLLLPSCTCTETRETDDLILKCSVMNIQFNKKSQSAKILFKHRVGTPLEVRECQSGLGKWKVGETVIGFMQLNQL